MEAITSDIDVFIGNKTYIDELTYNLWLQNVEAKAACYKLSGENADEQGDLFVSTLDQYRIFCMLEPMLQQPDKLYDQMLFQLTLDMKKNILLKYYEVEETIVREFIGRKLSKGTRRDLDLVATKSQKPLKICQRQFDNCRRIFKSVEDTQYNVADAIMKRFYLTEKLSRFFLMYLVFLILIFTFKFISFKLKNK